eukprot:gene496-624_t
MSEELIITLGAPTDDIWKDGESREYHTGALLCSTEYFRSIEPVGRQFEIIWKKINRDEVEVLGQSDDDDSSSTKNKEDGGNDDDQDENSESFKAFKEKYQKSHKEWAKQKETDHYEVMGLGDLRWRATEKDIKQAYKKMILVCHPDKNEGGSEEAFKLLQKSYQVLSDPKKRRVYDSTEPFDDDLPTASEVERGDFFKVFEPVFEMNSRWSSIQPAPKLGDLNTSFETVMKFYNFWWSFKSWRDFSFEDDYDLEQAESRDEKRWMERQNEKKRAKQKKDEHSRIQELANMAYKKDPRILKKVKEEEDKKNEVKRAKQEARKKLQEAAEALEREERLKKEEEEKKKKEEEEEKKRQKQQQAKTIQTSKDNFRKVCYGQPVIKFKIEDVELICVELSHLQLDEVTKSLSESKSDETTQKIFQEHFKQVSDSVKEREKKMAESKKTKVETEQNEKTWTDDELSQLAKAIQKYPSGMGNRWELVAQMIPTKSLKDVIAKAKAAQPTKAFAKPPVQSVSAYEKLKSKVGDKVIKSELSTRIEPLPTTTTSTATGEKKPAAKKEKAEAEWTVDEQKLLEEGLQKIDKSLEDRWDQIAAKVGTKSKKECIVRYKYLVNLYKSSPAK